MALGEPGVSVAALCHLYNLLDAFRLKANSPDGSNIIRENLNGKVIKSTCNT